MLDASENYFISLNRILLCMFTMQTPDAIFVCMCVYVCTCGCVYVCMYVCIFENT